MTQPDIVDAVREATGIRARAHAQSALRSVLDALGAMVSHPRRGALAQALPTDAAEAFLRRDYDKALDLDWLLETVADQEHVRDGAALEHIEAVFGVLRDRLGHDRWRVLASELPDRVAALEPPRRSAVPLDPGASAQGATPAPHGLSDGRPGSVEPLSEAHPSSDRTLADFDGDD